MNSKAVLVWILCVCCSFQVFGQKVKYKDLIVLLDAKQFDEAEPFLKKYLKENDDNPNAFLFMGMIYQEKSSKMDLLKQTDLLLTQIDSAIYYYKKASAGITEKEISRNDEYYQMYNRRDLRTGKFGIKLSDIQLDLEGRMKLKDRGKLISSLKSSFVLAEMKYNQTRQLFTAISAAYPSTKEFYLRADEKLIADLRHVEQTYDSCLIAFNEYENTLKQVGKSAYNQNLHPEDIRDFKRDGLSAADFYHDDLKIWDYKRWAFTSTETIEKEIVPLRDELVALDVEINKLQHQVKKDSVSVKGAIPGIRTKMTFAGLKKIDGRPMPLDLFNMKIAELAYGSQLVEDKPLRDSLNVPLQIAGVKEELRLAKSMDSLARLIDRATLDNDMEDYKHFVATAFGTPVVLKSLIKTSQEFASREVARKEAELKVKSEMLRWIISSPDSIPLFMEVSNTSRFRPLVIKDEVFTSGLQFQDSVATGYFYAISPSRKATLKTTFEIDKKAFNKRTLPFTKAISAQDEKGHVFFVLIYSEAKTNEKFIATVAKIYQSDGLSWQVNIQLDQLPVEMGYTPESAELLIKTRNAAGDLIPLILDKNGKVVK